MNKKVFIIGIIIVILIAIVGAFAFYKISDNNKENETFGLVVSIDNDVMKVKIEGNMYSFNIGNAEKSENSIFEEDIVKIKYVGKLENNKEATKVETVNELIKDDSDINTVKNDIKVTDDDVRYITGKVTEVTNDSMIVNANMDGKEYAFNVQNAQKDANIAKDDVVKVIHKGKVQENVNGDKKEALSVHKLDVEKKENSTEKTIMGTVKDVRDNVLIVESNDKLYAFATDSIEKKETVVAKEVVVITYKGNLSESSNVTAVGYKKQ